MGLTRKLAALVAAAGFVASGCASSASSPPAAPGASPTPAQTAQSAAPATPEATASPAAVTRPIVIVAKEPESASLDPAENWAGGGPSILAQVYEGLFRTSGDTTTSIDPWLAAEVPTKANGGISADGLVYTIKLKPGAKFHDGATVDAAAVVFSFTRTQSLKLGPDGISAGWIAKMEAVDPQTVRFTLTQPFGDFLASLTSPWGNFIVSPTTVKAHDVNGDQAHAWLPDHDAGSGPYTISSVDHASNTITIERVKDYWGGWSDGPHIDRAIYRFGVDSATARSMIEKGDADVVVNLSSDDFSHVQSAAGIVTKTYPSVAQINISWNNSVAPFKDKKVRQALQYTFDFETVKSQIFGGYLEKLVGVIGPAYPEAYPPQTTYSFDLDKAKQLLAADGYEENHPLEFSINLPHYWPNDTAVAQVWQSDLAKIGVKMSILQTDVATFNTAWYGCTAGTAPGVGQGFTGGISGDYASAWETIWQVYPSYTRKCSTFYSTNTQADDLFKQIAGQTDTAARKPLMESLNELLTEDAQALWIGQTVDLIAVRDVVQGYAYTDIWGSDYVPLASMSLTK